MALAFSVSFRRRQLGRSAVCISMAVLAAPGLFAQSGGAGSAAVDPYTHAAPETMATLGYVSFGPFPFGTNHTTADIVALLPTEPLRWLETAHFRIGSALPFWDADTDRRWAAEVRLQLATLARQLPNVDPRTKQLDPWLRLHLVAQRAEQIYTDVLLQLGRQDGDFPAAPGHDASRGEEFLGLGPYLGLPQKFTILLVQQPQSLARYTAAHLGWATERPSRHHDHRFGSAFFGAATGSDGGLLAQDEALHTHLAFHVAHNLFTSYRSYGHNLPAWLITGLAHRFARRVSERFPVYDLRRGPGSAPDDYLAWERRRYQLMGARKFEPLTTFVERMDVDGYSMDDHLQSWAFVDYLMTARRAETMLFLERMKDPFHGRLRFPTNEELFARQRSAMEIAFGGSAKALEAAWRAYRPTRVARAR